jgi:hypothetical protein
VNAVKNLFAVKDVRFYSKGDSDILNLFQGFPYDVNNETKGSSFSEHLIKPF